MTTYNYSAAYHNLGDAVRFYHKIINTSTVTEIPNIVNFSINRQVNAPASWSVTLLNESPNRIYSPFASSGTYKGLLSPDIYTSAHVINRVFYITITLSDYVYTSPYLVLENVNYSTNGTVTLSGTDWSKRLTLENQSMTSWLSTPGDIQYAANIISSIMTAYGCGSVDMTGFPQPPNFPVKILHFQNEKPWDPLLRLFDIVGAHWCVKQNNQFKIWVPQDYATATPIWTFEHGVSLINLGYTKSSGNVINKVTIGKAEAGSDIVGVGDGTQYGRHSISFEPARGVALVPEMLNNCVLIERGVYLPTEGGLQTSFQEYSMTTWTDMNGQKYGYAMANDTGVEGGTEGDTQQVLPIGSMGAVPLVQVDFTIGVRGTPLDPTAYIPEPCYWRLHVSGKRVSDETEVFGPFEELKSIIVKDSTLIAKYGECPAPDLPENPLIYDRQCAINYGTRIIQDSCRALETCEVSIPFNPAVELGDHVKIICGDLDMNHMFCVEGINLGIDFSNGSVTCNVACSRYQHSL